MEGVRKADDALIQATSLQNSVLEWGLKIAVQLLALCVSWRQNAARPFSQFIFIEAIVSFLAERVCVSVYVCVVGGMCV